MMSSFRQVRDTFLHFLADNISLTVHALRSDPNAPDAAVFQMNAVNVHFLNLDGGVDISTQHVSIDVVYDAENDAVDAINTVWTVLNASFSCPLLDYTVPSTPTASGTGNIFWNQHGVKFRSVRSDFYSHYVCSLKLGFHPS